MVKLYTKYQITICKHNEKSAENWSAGLMDRRTECKPKVPFDFVGRGLIINALMFNLVVLSILLEINNDNLDIW